MREICITIPGTPRPKVAPNVTRNGTFTPKAARVAESNITAIVMQQTRGRRLFDGPMSVRITAYFPIAKSWTKKKKDAALNGSLAHTTTPDADNLVKLVWDGLNASGIWIDDRYVTKFSMAKEYSTTPRTEILICETP